ncbi:CPBP family intramembrane glutamic endopeptidase [Alkalihalobacillus sp. CinArs1]|uniref:CPBP family intramembrane glutamic endopeptidase n=1 Tax=Alkalihalobacillus sp. CinArs1 TaxID=2995314 RepID=UPI0022DE396D|nr:CPBP family intramembrane glutamic endopeptidase [Alkalihalobacillus sp. CinArs1]
MHKKDIYVSLILSSLCLVAGFFVVPYQLETLKTTMPEQHAELISTLPFPISVLSLITAIQLFIVSFILAFLGMKLAKRTGLSLKLLPGLVTKQKVSLHTRSLLLSLLFGLITAFVISTGDRFFFQSHIPALSAYTPSFSPLGLFVGVMYGGVFEEILMRLFLMSFLVWIINKAFNRKKEIIPATTYVIAIIIASALFAAGHLPATQLMLGDLTPLLTIRSFLLNGIGGLFFGYLYWKKGFEYAVLGHMFSHIALQLLFIPIYY